MADSQIKMNPELKARWLDALRSGKFKQTRSALADNGGHCCLGVLCEIAASEMGFKVSVSNDGSTAYNDEFELPNEDMCMKLFGVPHTPDVRIHGKLKSLDAHNDDGRRFTTIANAIEKQL